MDKPKRTVIKRAKVTLFVTVIFCFAYGILYFSNTSIPFLNTSEEDSSELFPESINYILFTDGCKIPKFDPFDPTVLKYIKNITGDIPCKGKRYLDVVNNTVIIHNIKVNADFPDGSFSCTYRPILRNPQNKTKRADNIFQYGKENELRFNEPMPAEFLKAFCSGKYQEFLASTPIKQEVEERCQERSNNRILSDKMNIIVVGIDSISKINFERHFKLTAEYLRNNLSAFEFHGYMKVADNTFPNLTPMLTGHFIEHYYNDSRKDRYFDDLDFIWKNFSSIGYRTLLAEDAPDMATYNYIKNGFQFPPTDYFFRPITLAIEDSPWQKASKTDCFQAKPEILTLFDYLRSFLLTMKDRPYFAFTWAARLTHGDVNKAAYADKPSFELLRDINNMDLLNKSILVFMSDHGIRFGGIRKTYIGKIEERMPFLFLSFPPWFLKAHPDIAINLAINQNRLTTPFDVHETLVELYQMISGDKNYIRTPYGISLFKEIPLSRSCKSAFIIPHWCVCHEYKKISPKSEIAIDTAKLLLNTINNLTLPYRASCSELELDTVLDLRMTKPHSIVLKYVELEKSGDENSAIFDEEVESYTDYLISIQTKPGGGEFETTVRRIKDNFQLTDISRINKYGNKGDCVPDADMHKYCYCYRNL